MTDETSAAPAAPAAAPVANPAVVAPVVVAPVAKPAVVAPKPAEAPHIVAAAPQVAAHAEVAKVAAAKPKRSTLLQKIEACVWQFRGGSIEGLLDAIEAIVEPKAAAAPVVAPKA